MDMPRGRDALASVEVVPETTRLIGVYDARGSLLGEVAYLWGKVRGTRHCSLCDITGGSVDRLGDLLRAHLSGRPA